MLGLTINEKNLLDSLERRERGLPNLLYIRHILFPKWQKENDGILKEQKREQNDN